jgi:hypothetical protein
MLDLFLTRWRRLRHRPHLSVATLPEPEVGDRETPRPSEPRTEAEWERLDREREGERREQKP